MRATPRLNPIPENSILSIEVLNSLINRIEYGADALQAYRALAGNGITIEQERFGRVINGIGGTSAEVGEIPWNTRFAGNGANTMDGRPQLYVVNIAAWPIVNSRYAVWVNPAEDPLVRQPQTIFRTVNFNTSGEYSFIMSADNTLTVYLDNVLVGSIINEVSGFLNSLVVTKNVTAGRHVIKFVAENTVGGSTWATNPAGYSLEIQGIEIGVMASGYLVASNPNLSYGPNGVYGTGYVFNNAAHTIAIVTTPKYPVGTYSSYSYFPFATAYYGSIDGISVDAGYSLQIKYLENVILAINGPKVVNNVHYKNSVLDFPNLAGNGYAQYWSSANWYTTDGFKESVPQNVVWEIRKTPVNEVGIGDPQLQ